MNDHSIYERMGGDHAIDAAVDVFYQRVTNDARIAHYFTGLDMNLQYRKQKAFLTMAFGGTAPSGPPPALRKAHARLQLTESDFDAVIEHLGATLVALKLPPELVAEATNVALSVKSDVLNL